MSLESRYLPHQSFKGSAVLIISHIGWTKNYKKGKNTCKSLSCIVLALGSTSSSDPLIKLLSRTQGNEAQDIF